MKNIVQLVVLVLSLFAISVTAAPLHKAPSQKSPFKMLVQTSKTYVHSGFYTYRFKYTITSMTDGLVINDVVLNRGRCKTNIVAPVSAEKERQIMERLNRNAIMSRENRTPAQPTQTRGVSGVINFGNTWSFTSQSNPGFTECAPLEVVVNTNFGGYTFTY